MTSRLLIAAVLAALALPAAAAAQTSTARTFSHDASLDGTAQEIHSGLWNGDDSSGDPLASRYANTYETFEVDVPAGTRHGSLTATITWDDARIDLDVSLYRIGADGRPTGRAIARGASSAAAHRASETAAYSPGAPVDPGRYMVIVDNVCSRDADDDPRTPEPDSVNCGIGEDVPDEDAFNGTVTLGNELPSVTLDGPDTGVTGQPVTFDADARDLDGSIAAYYFDLNGDGVYELDSDGARQVSTTFRTPGTYTVGVQVTDDTGDVAYALHRITISAPPPKTVKRPPPILSFRANAKSFGGRGLHWLVVRYKLSERARITLVLRRDGHFVRRIGAGVRARRHRYTIVLKPAHLKPGVYTVTLSLLGTSGRTQVAQVKARRY